MSQIAISLLSQRTFALASVLNGTVRIEGENPAIGIILCRSKNETIVEYALRESEKPIGVAMYRMVSTLPEPLKTYLPAPEQIAKRMEGIG